MNDFFNGFWPLFITVVSIVGMLFCAWIAWVYGRPDPEVDARGGETTGHVWDGDLQETNQPMPRWMLWSFILSVAFSFGYLALYPGLGAYQGILGWSAEGQHEQQKLAHDERIAAAYSAFEGMTPEQMAGDDSAVSMGASLFLNTCAQCHGSDARGSRGYPNLTDDDWLHGGSVEALRHTIAKGRIGVMPPQAAAVGTATDIRNVAAYVLSLSGTPTDGVAASRGRAKFAAVCAACHGAEGKGNPALGAPNLTDRVWLYGGSEAAIIESITNGRTGTMPAHENRLSPQQIDLLVAYVLNVSGSTGK